VEFACVRLWEIPIPEVGPSVLFPGDFAHFAPSGELDAEFLLAVSLFDRAREARIRLVF
jgi:hypothetical protein